MSSAGASQADASLSGRLPRITLKLATSLDGRIALADGRSQWITGPEARARGRELRRTADAVLTGIGTVLTDDPLLTARGGAGEDSTREDSAGEADGWRDLRIILDSTARLPLHSRLVSSLASGPVVVAHGPNAPAQRLSALAAAGVLLHEALLDADGRIGLKAAMRALAARFGLRHGLVEAGGTLAGAFLREGLVDAVEWFRAPVLIGGEGQPCVDFLALADLSHALRFGLWDHMALGEDRWERYRRIDPHPD